MKLLLYYLLIFPFLLHAQIIDQNKPTVKEKQGILWTHGLTWDQIKAKAKKEKKFIFVDCYTTWCTPCKRMDKQVYVNKNVGDYMNKRFVCIKVQMDKTKLDDELVTSWYADAQMIKQQYKVSSFPTYLFFSPEGYIVHRSGSYQSSDDFVATAKKSLDVKGQYYSLVRQYEQGVKDYEKMPYLISVAKKMKETTLIQRLVEDYLGYLYTLNKDDLYTKEKIEFIASTIRSTRSVFFKLFYPNGDRVNAVMGQSGYARRIADSAIAREIINPVLSKLSGANEPDWQGLCDAIKNEFGVQYAERNILWQKARWHDAKGDIPYYTKFFIDLVRINGLDTSSIAYGDGWLNYVAYNNIFGGNPFVLSGSTDTSEINAAIQWMEGVVQRASKHSPEWYAMTLDTYAMLLYKSGNKKEALTWEDKALQIAREINAEDDRENFQSKINMMIKNEPTWKIN